MIPNSSTKEYVLGFLFNPDKTKVILIEKVKPSWQKGLLNGVGGKIEEGETAGEAITREFEEETGVNIPILNWQYIHRILDNGMIVYCFKATSSDFDLCRTTTPERIKKQSISTLYKQKTINNLKWLIHLCLDEIHSFSISKYKNRNL